MANKVLTYIKFSGWIVSVLTLFSTSVAAQTKTRLSLEHYFEMEFVSDPQISPDGDRIVYTRQWIDRVNDRKKSAVWIMDREAAE